MSPINPPQVPNTIHATHTSSFLDHLCLKVSLNLGWGACPLEPAFGQEHTSTCMFLFTLLTEEEAVTRSGLKS